MSDNLTSHLCFYFIFVFLNDIGFLLFAGPVAMSCFVSLSVQQTFVMNKSGEDIFCTNICDSWALLKLLIENPSFLFFNNTSISAAIRLVGEDNNEDW